MCEHKSLSTPPHLGACAAHHCQGPVIQGQLPQEERTARIRLVQRHAGSATVSSPRNRNPPSPWPELARAPESAAPLSPSCLSKEQTPSGDLHTETGPNPKLNNRRCANKEEKVKFLPAASGAVD